MNPRREQQSLKTNRPGFLEDQLLPRPLVLPPNGFNSPTRINGFEGLSIEEAQSRAVEAGWEFIEVRSLDFDETASDSESAGRLADYLETMLGLYEEDGVVIEAWSGGYRT